MSNTNTYSIWSDVEIGKCDARVSSSAGRIKLRGVDMSPAHGNYKFRVFTILSLPEKQIKLHETAGVYLNFHHFVNSHILLHTHTESVEQRLHIRGTNAHSTHTTQPSVLHDLILLLFLFLSRVNETSNKNKNTYFWTKNENYKKSSKFKTKLNDLYYTFHVIFMFVHLLNS